MADTFSALMQLLPAPMQTRALALVTQKTPTVAEIDRNVAIITATRDQEAFDDSLYSATRNAARQAALTEIAAQVAAWDVADPPNAPHFAEYLAGFPAVDVSNLSDNMYAYQIKNKLSVVVYTGGPGNAVIDANKERLEWMNVNRLHEFFGTQTRVAAYNTGLTYLSTQRAYVIATADLYDSVY